MNRGFGGLARPLIQRRTRRLEQLYPLGHPDVRPLVPSLWDDEFDDTPGNSGPGQGLQPKWQKRNFGSTTLGFTGGSAVWLNTPGQAGDNIRGIEQAMPTAGTWQFRAKLAVLGAGANFWNSGLYIFNSANGRLITLGPNFSTNPVISCYKWTSVSAFSGTAANLASAFSNYFMWHYYEVEYNGTNLRMRISPAGADLYPQLLFGRNFLDETPATFLGAVPTHIGIYNDPNNASNSCQVWCDWIRRVA